MRFVPRGLVYLRLDVFGLYDFLVRVIVSVCVFLLVHFTVFDLLYSNKFISNFHNYIINPISTLKKINIIRI